MNRWKKAAALVATAALASTAGAAWAQSGPENSAPAGRALPAPAKALGGSAPETVFTPITPCRIVDTRSQAGGKLQLDNPRSFKVRGSGGAFALQGGKANGCGIPSSSGSVEVTITAVDSGSGFLRAWPSGGAQPVATFLNYTDVVNISNTGTLGICNQICVVNQDLRLRAFGTPTHVVIDVQGYYQQQMAAHVSGAGALERNSRATSVQKLSTGTYVVKFDRDISACAYTGSTGRLNDLHDVGIVSTTGASGDPNAVYVTTKAPNGSAADLGFYVHVTC